METFSPGQLGLSTVRDAGVEGLGATWHVREMHCVTQRMLEEAARLVVMQNRDDG